MLSDNQVPEEPTPAELKARLGDMCREYQALSVKADHAWNEAIEAAANFIRANDMNGDVIAGQILSLTRPSQPVKRQELSNDQIEAVADDRPLDRFRNIDCDIDADKVVEFARAIIAKDRGQA
jgi:hypothetical protein